MMTRDEKKLVNNVCHIIKALYSVETINNVKITYNFVGLEAMIMWPPKTKWTGNGHSRFYSNITIDNLKEVSDKYGIPYFIGHEDNLELIIKIGV